MAETWCSAKARSKYDQADWFACLNASPKLRLCGEWLAFNSRPPGPGGYPNGPWFYNIFSTVSVPQFISPPSQCASTTSYIYFSSWIGLQDGDAFSGGTFLDQAGAYGKYDCKKHVNTPFLFVEEPDKSNSKEAPTVVPCTDGTMISPGDQILVGITGFEGGYEGYIWSLSDVTTGGCMVQGTTTLGYNGDPNMSWGQGVTAAGEPQTNSISVKKPKTTLTGLGSPLVQGDYSSIIVQNMPFRA